MRIRAIILLLISVPLLARPAGGRTYVECVDGTPCRVAMSAQSRRSCCQPSPCQPAADSHRCVVRATPAVDALLSPPATIDPAMIAPLALLPTPAIVPPLRLTALTAAVADESPPGCLWSKEDHAPRGPPVEHV